MAQFALAAAALSAAAFSAAAFSAAAFSAAAFSAAAFSAAARSAAAAYHMESWRYCVALYLPGSVACGGLTYCGILVPRYSASLAMY